MEEEKSLKEKVDVIFSQLEPAGEKKSKNRKMKLPRKAKVRKSKAKKGYVGIVRIDENRNITGEKIKIEDSAFGLKGGTNHATDASEICFWEGKYPVLFQETKSINPIKFNQGKNETYGQKYIMAKMLKDAIKIKSKGGGLIIWIVVGGAIFLVAKSIFNF